MPGFVKTDRDEELWAKAQEIVQEQYGRTDKSGKRYWRLVTSIFRRMKKSLMLKAVAAGSRLLVKSNPNWRKQRRNTKGQWVVGGSDSLSAEVERGLRAMKRVIRDHVDVEAAMHRGGLGDVSFYWGTPGDASRGFRGGYGVSHIIARRDAEGKSGESIARKMVEVIARGEIGQLYGPSGGERVNVSYDGHTAVLSHYKESKREMWLLTGWDDDKESSGDAKGVNPTGTYTRHPSGIQSGAGAEDSTKKSIPHSGLPVNLQSGHLLLKAYRRGHWHTSRKGKRYWVPGHNTKQQAANPEYVGFREWKQVYISNLKPANEAIKELFGRFSWSGSELGSYFEVLKKPSAADFELINQAFGRKGSALTGITPMRTDGRYVYQAKRWGPDVLLFRADLRGLYESHVKEHPDSMLLTRKQWQPLAASLGVGGRLGLAKSHSKTAKSLVVIFDPVRKRILVKSQLSLGFHLEGGSGSSHKGSHRFGGKRIKPASSNAALRFGEPEARKPAKAPELTDELRKVGDALIDLDKEKRPDHISADEWEHHTAEMGMFHTYRILTPHMVASSLHPERMRALGVVKQKLADAGFSNIREVKEARQAELAEETKPEPKARGFHASPDEVPYDLAYSAYRNSSFTPEKRARDTQEGYAEHMQAVYEHLGKYADTPEKQALLDSEMARYKEGYLEKLKARLAADSRTASSMITGPANFPVERNRKRMETAHKRLEELLEYDKRAQHAIHQKLAPPEKRAISSDEPDAAGQLRGKLSALQARQDRMKQVNAAFRKTKGQKGWSDKLDLTEEEKKEIAENIRFGSDAPYPGWALSNNNANIKRVQERIADVEKRRADTTSENAFAGGKIVDNVEANRLQIIFDSKPDADVRAHLKAHGFRWAPSEGAWQRQRSADATYWANKILGTEKSLAGKVV